MKYFGIIFALFFSCIALAKPEAYFTPSRDCENKIINLIKKSQNTIDVAVYAINNDAIVDALKDAHNRGVVVRVLTDRIQAGQKKSRVSELEDAGILLMRHKKYRIQHDKFAIFDSKKIVTGSYNWTNSASRYNAENCLFLSDKTREKYIQRFETLWNLNKELYTKEQIQRAL